MGTIPKIKELWDGNVPLFRHKVARLLGSGRAENTVGTNPYRRMTESAVNPYADYGLDVTGEGAGGEAAFEPSAAASANVPQIEIPSESAVAGTSPGTAAKTSAGAGGAASQSVPSHSDSGIVNAAEKYIGTPYVWGGESMAEGGMDCSGFVYNALRDAGYDVGRTTAQGYRGYGKSVSKSDLQPGDLVFYGKNGKASHIGIYIGNGQMIHSTGDVDNTKEKPGKGVTVADINYRGDFLEARRC